MHPSILRTRCTLLVCPRSKLFLRAASTKATKVSPNEKNEKDWEKADWKMLPNTEKVDEVPVEELKRTRPKARRDEGRDEGPVNIWNEPVVDRRARPRPSAESKSAEKSGPALHDRIKSKISQAQKRVFQPSAMDLPKPVEIASLIGDPETPLMAEPATEETQVAEETKVALETKVAEETKATEEKVETKIPSRTEIVNTEVQGDLAYTGLPFDIQQRGTQAPQEKQERPKIPPRRPRPSTDPNSLAGIVPRLECVAHKREGSASRRAEWPVIDLPQVCFVGRTNSGKSSLLNQFFRGRHLAKSSSRPGVTSALDFYTVDDKLTFVDTPGYGTNLKAQARGRWEAMVKEFLTHSPNLKLVCLLMDITTLPTDDDLSILRLVQKRCGRIASAAEIEELENDNGSSGKGFQLDDLLGDDASDSCSSSEESMSSSSSSSSASDEGSEETEEEMEEGEEDGESSESEEQQEPQRHIDPRVASLLKDIQSRHAAIAAETNPARKEDSESGTTHPIPVLLILTKDDHVNHDQRANLVHRIKRRLQWSGPFLCYSIKDRRGRGKLLRHIMTTLFQPENSLLLQDLARPDFVPYGSAEHRGTVVKDNRTPHWKLKQEAEFAARQRGEKVAQKKKAKKRLDQEGPIRLTEATF